MWYVYNKTGDPLWQLLGRDIIDNIQKYCRYIYLHIYKALSLDRWTYLSIHIYSSNLFNTITLLPYYVIMIYRTKCGYATIDVGSKKLINEMESFFLSETVKYLYLLYDTQCTNILYTIQKRYSMKHIIFNTEAHPLWLPVLTDKDNSNNNQNQKNNYKEEL